MTLWHTRDSEYSSPWIFVCSSNTFLRRTSVCQFCDDSVSEWWDDNQSTKKNLYCKLSNLYQARRISVCQYTKSVVPCCFFSSWYWIMIPICSHIVIITSYTWLYNICLSFRDFSKIENFKKNYFSVFFLLNIFLYDTIIFVREELEILYKSVLNRIFNEILMRIYKLLIW